MLTLVAAIAKHQPSNTVKACPLKPPLLQDQAERCLDLGIDTVIWNHETSEDQRSNIERELRGGEPDVKLIYTTPESLRTPRLTAVLKVPGLPRGTANLLSAVSSCFALQ